MNVNRIGQEDSADNGPLLTREPNRELVQPNAAHGPPAAHHAAVPVANLTADSAADSAAVAAPDPIDNLEGALNALQLAPSPGTPAEAAPAHTQREWEAPARRGLHFSDDSDALAVPSSKPEPLAVGLVDSEDDTTNPSPDRDREVAPRDRTLFDAVRADMGGFMSAAAQAGPTFGAVFPHILGIVQQAQAGQRATDSDKTALAALTKVLTTMSLKVKEVLQPGMSFKFVDGPGVYAYIIRSLNVTAFFRDAAAQNTGWCVVKVGMTNKVLTERVKEEVNEISSKWRPGTAALQPRVNLNKPPACPPDPECDDSRDVVFTLQGFNFTGEERDCRNAMCDSGFHIGEAELDRENKPCIDTVDAISSKISPSNYPKKKQVCPRPFTEKYKLKSDLGWATWLMANGGKSTIGPSEFIVMPTPAVEKLQAKYAAGKVCSAADLRRNLESLDDAARPDAFGLNFVETTQSLGPLRFWSKSAKV